jgi:hypothetical protein
VNNATTVYGAPNYSFTSTVTGTQNNDQFTELYSLKGTTTPVLTSGLAVGSYTISPTFAGDKSSNYTLTINSGTLVVTPAPAGITIAGPSTTAPSCSPLLPTGCNGILASKVPATAPAAPTTAATTYTFALSTLVPNGQGSPTGTLTLYDVFTPITPNGYNTAPLTAVAAAGGANTTACGGLGTSACTVYTGTLPGGAGGGYVGLTLTVTGFTNAGNNGIFLCIASSATSVTLANTAGVAETNPGTLAGSLPNAPVLIPLPALGTGGSPAATAFYTVTNPALGLHAYAVAYSGDSNFQPIQPACIPPLQSFGTTACNSAISPTFLTIDNADFTFTQVQVSTTASATVSPYSGTTVVSPGLIPGTNSGTEEQSNAQLQPVLGMSGTVTFSCAPQNPSYVTCTINPPSESLSATSTSAITGIVVSVSTPATLPLGFNFSTGVAFVPLGLLAFCTRRRRRKLSKALWMLAGLVAISMGMTACGGGNLVQFFTPVPVGVQYVVVTATGTSPTTNTVVTRSFPMEITIE